MRLVTNSVDASNIKEQQIGGTRYYVAEDIPFIRAQELAGGYVPSDHVTESAPGWHGEPLPLNHPRNDAGQIVSANGSEGERVNVGQVENPKVTDDGTGVKGDLRINVDRAESLGPEGRDLVESLENGDGVEVSSQYFADDLPAGNYDGEYRSNVEGNLQPDGVALLPSKKGVCSLPDCGVAPTANEATPPGDDRHLSVTAETQPDDDGAESNGVELIRRGLSVLSGAVTPDGGETPTANCGDCDGDCDACSGDKRPTDNEDSDNSNNMASTVDLDQEMVVEMISEQTELDSETLSELDSDSLKTIYQSAVKGSSSSDDPDGKEQEREMVREERPVGNAEELVDEMEDRLDDIVEEKISANEEQTEKERLADEIVANSAEYDNERRDELVATPTSVLNDIHDSVTTETSGLPASSGPSANADVTANSDAVDIDDVGSGVINYE